MFAPPSASLFYKAPGREAIQNSIFLMGLQIFYNTKQLFKQQRACSVHHILHILLKKILYYLYPEERHRSRASKIPSIFTTFA